MRMSGIKDTHHLPHGITKEVPESFSLSWFNSKSISDLVYGRFNLRNYFSLICKTVWQIMAWSKAKCVYNPVYIFYYLKSKHERQTSDQRKHLLTLNLHKWKLLTKKVNSFSILSKLKSSSCIKFIDKKTSEIFIIFFMKFISRSIWKKVIKIQYIGFVNQFWIQILESYGIDFFHKTKIKTTWKRARLVSSFTSCNSLQPVFSLWTQHSR